MATVMFWPRRENVSLRQIVEAVVFFSLWLFGSYALIYEAQEAVAVEGTYSAISGNTSGGLAVSESGMDEPALANRLGFATKGAGNTDWHEAWEYYYPGIDCSEDSFLAYAPLNVSESEVADLASRCQASVQLERNEEIGLLVGRVRVADSAGLMATVAFFESSGLFSSLEPDSYTWVPGGLEAPLFRFAGDDVFDTSVWAVRGGGDAPFFTEYKSGRAVVVASVNCYQDALAACARAGSLDGRIVFAHADGLPEQTQYLLSYIKPSRIVAVGGEQTLAPQVLDALRATVPEASIERIAGSDAVATANAIAKEMGTSETAIVLASTVCQDAMSAGAYSYHAKVPIFLAGSDGKLSAETTEAVFAAGARNVYIVGGPDSVAPEAESQLGALFAGRIWGPSAVDTSMEFARWSADNGCSLSHVGFAGVDAWQDAVLASVNIGCSAGVVMLLDDLQLGKADALVEQAWAEHETPSAYLFGGSSHLSDDTYLHLNRLYGVPEWLLEHALT